MAHESMVVVMRVYCSFEKNDQNAERARMEHTKMIEAAEHLMRNGVSNIVFSVLVGKHPDADKWDTATVLGTHFKMRSSVQVHSLSGDPFYSVIQMLLLMLASTFEEVLFASYTSIHFLTPEVLREIDTAFREGAMTVAVVPPDMPTGLVGAANNQCMAWNLQGLVGVGGFDSRDAKPHDFDMQSDKQGVGEIIPAYRLGPDSMAVIIPNVEAGDTRDTPEQMKKRANKERRISAWLERDGLGWDDLKKLIRKGYPIDLRG